VPARWVSGTRANRPEPNDTVKETRSRSQSLTGITDRRLLFVTGKGGVGKSAVAAGFAIASARRGRRTLLVSMDGKPTVCPEVEHLTTSVHSTEEALREYIRLYVKIPLVTRLGPLAQTLDFVADAAPGVKEILAVGKLCHEVRANHYDTVVADAESSGHIVGQLSTPATIRSLAQFGMIREQTNWMIDMLENPAVTAALVVTTPEESPVDETIELVEALRTTARVTVPLVVVNSMPEVAPRVDVNPIPRILEFVARRHEAAFGEVRRLSEAVGAIDIVSLSRIDGSSASELPARIADQLVAELGEDL